MNGHATVTDKKGTANKKDEVETHAQLEHDKEEGLGSQKGHLATDPKSKGNSIIECMYI